MAYRLDWIFSAYSCTFMQLRQGAAGSSHLCPCNRDHWYNISASLHVISGKHKRPGWLCFYTKQAGF